MGCNRACFLSTAGSEIDAGETEIEMRRWVTKNYQIDCAKIAQRYHISEITAEVLVKRGLFNWEDMDAYLFPDMERLTDPSLMKDLKKTAGILNIKIHTNKKILIVGDYDVDGVMSTYILYHGLELLGAEVGYRLPHRVRDGYGMRAYMADEAREGGFDTIITCDNGISAADAVARAKELGMTVLVTDHHEVPSAGECQLLPPADCVVDPKQRGCAYPFKELCGAGIVYRLMEYMFERAGREDAVRELLPFAAVATVCDVVPLLGENRILAKNGLRELQNCHNAGLRELIRQQQIDRDVRAGDLGFRIGPCINAAGRLTDAAEAMELLLSGEAQARERAQRLTMLNEERKDNTARAFDRAVEIVRGREESVIVVYLKDCHESVAGIVAGRLKEKYYRPVLVITDSGEGLKGSARSVPGYHMQREIQKCKSLLTEFGGHAMAAGFSLPAENLEAFREMINRNCTMSDADMVESISFDREVPLAEMTEQIVGELEWLEPLGEGNAGALFARRGVKMTSVQLCGRENQIARLQVKDGVRTFYAVDFHWADHLEPAVTGRYGDSFWESFLCGGQPGAEVDILYRPKINERFGGVEFEIVDCR